MLAFSAFALVSCGDEGGGENPPAGGGNADYSVTVIDCNDAPLSGVIVKVMENGSLVNMYVTDAQGVVSFNLPKKNYTVEIDYIGGYAFTYDQSAVTLSADKHTTTVKLYRGLPEATASLNLASGDNAKAPMITNGTYTLTVSDEITYVVFYPEVRGRHLISVSGGAEVSYHGVPAYVQEHDLTENGNKVEGGFYLDIRAYHLPGVDREASKYVFGIRSDVSATVELKIERVADLAPDIQEVPWNDHTLSKTPDVYHVAEEGESVTLVDFDLTDPNLTVVYNADDGLYHYGTADGPVVLLRLASETPNAPDFPGFAKLLELTGFYCYVYDEDGNFVSKEQYHDMMLQYVSAADPDEGVYPLTKNLAEAIQNYGESNEWWDKSANNRFFGAAILEFADGKAWLFACCYAVVD